ncbi:hypothetical protein [Leptotrichia sp. oral taxon 223]|uniref:hypothetical protein n=1 Tax=Leptotrichia sp. oral taxon 223 TaxID=712363 RepID=UPI0015BB3601|nr:hypothetical protein [Leptotrichia sp. oral taxon 223]NWO20056.1 hypothetical protein [Leptotrichia sp. oral taxon 223]
MEQRITRNVTEFTAGAGFLDVKGTVKQVGSLIDGNFTLNSNGYEHEDLKDIDKSRNIGINMTFTPGVTEIYRNGRLTGEATGGVAVGTRLNYSETDYVAKVKATVGEVTGITVNGEKADLSGVNRDINNMVEVKKDKKILPMNIDLGTEYWLNDYSREKLKTAMDKASTKYNIEKIRNELTYLNIKRIQEKAERGEKLSEKEKEVYSFIEETRRLYFEYTDNSKEKIKKYVDISKINNDLSEDKKLYIVNERGEKELSYDNIEKFLKNYIDENFIEKININNEKYLGGKTTEAEYVVGAVYTLIYEEKIEKNEEYQKFQDEWITRGIVNIHNNKYIQEQQKTILNKGVYSGLEGLDEKDERVKERIKEINEEIIKEVQKSTQDTLERYLYKNYNNNKFAVKNGIITVNRIKFNVKPNIDSAGRWENPSVKTDLNLGSSAYYDMVSKEIVVGNAIRNIGTVFHENNHGVQDFFGINYNQLANKGYNDKLADVGRWFILNNIYTAPNGGLSAIYAQNLREYDSMNINATGYEKYTSISRRIGKNGD